MGYDKLQSFILDIFTQIIFCVLAELWKCLWKTQTDAQYEKT